MNAPEDKSIYFRGPQSRWQQLATQLHGRDATVLAADAPASLFRTVGDRNKYGTYHRDQTGLDYADQRYYISTIGRFLSADPYEASSGAGDPVSWGWGVYVQSDPVNFADADGLLRSSAEGGGHSGVFFIPGLVFSVFKWIFGAPPSIKDPRWQTDAQVRTNTAVAEAAFWKAHENDEDTLNQEPMFLRVIDDCFKRPASTGGGIESKPLVRRRRYQVVDRWGAPIANTGALRVEEQHGVRFSPAGFTTGGVWGRGSKSPFGPDAMFDDFLSTGGNGDIWTYQTFTASAPGVASTPLAVLEGGNIFTILGIHMQNRRININGNEGPIQNGRVTKYCDKPDL